MSDALIYADQTVGPNGRSMTVEQRAADVLHRHGPASAHAAAHADRAPVLRAAVHRVQQRLTARAAGGCVALTRAETARPSSHR